MSSKSQIFKNLTKVNNTPLSKPRLLDSCWQSTNPIEDFTKALELAGGEAIIVDREKDFNSLIDRYFSSTTKIIDTRKYYLEQDKLDKNQTWDLSIIEGKIGVAENGAVWVDWNDNYPRTIITLSKNILIILSKDTIVSNMQEAYSKIDLSNISYGTFLAGPSKTADIEQSLVIGAHGAIGLKIFLI